MNTWQRRVRLALAVFVAVFAAGLFFALRREPPKPDTAPVRRSDPTAALESRGGVSIQLKGEREQLKVESEETFVYANGTRKLKGVTVTVSERAGRSFVLTGREGEVGPDDSSVKVTEDIKLVVSDGLTVTAGEAFYTKTDGVVRAPGPVRFSRGRLSGSAVGMTHDRDTDVLALLDQVAAEVAPDDAGTGGTKIVAGSAALARGERQLRFTRGVRLLRARRALESDAAVAYLTDDETRVRRIEMRGGSRVVGGGDAPGSLETMSARDMDLAYAEEGDALERAILAGSAVVQIAGEPGARGRRIAGEWMDIQLAPDGATVTSLLGRESVRLDLPPEGDAPGHTIRASVLEARGAAATGITSAVFTGSVEFREEGKPPMGPRVAHAGAMRLALKAGFGALEHAWFTGGVTFEDGDLTASAREARYGVTTGQLALTGSEDRTGRPPQVVDPKVTIAGTRVELLLDGRRVSAQGAVSSELRASAAAAPPAGQRAQHLPALLKRDQPVFVTADSLAYDGAAGLAVYAGHGRLWQGDTSVAGDRLTLNDTTGDLTAGGSVRAQLMMVQTDEQAKTRTPAQTRGRGESMTYTDETRRLVFTRGATAQANLAGPQGDITGDRIDALLNKSGDELDRLEAEGSVILKLPPGRAASGRHLVYTVVDGRYVMVGAPVEIQEQLAEGCRITTGTTLTFFKSTDRIVADGNQERRTETKSGVKCSLPGFD